MIDLAGLGDLYVARVGHRSQALVADYLFDEVKPELLNIHTPSQYLHDDPRLERDYLSLGTGLWGENWARKTLELDGLDERCAPHSVQAVRLMVKQRRLVEELAIGSAISARDLWLCARAHVDTKALPDVAGLASRLAASGLGEADPARAKAFLDAAVTLDPRQIAAAQRLLELRLTAATPPSHR